MRFSDINHAWLTRLRLGIRRTPWPEWRAVSSIHGHKRLVVHDMVDDCFTSGDWQPTDDDIAADDWVTIGEPRVIGKIRKTLLPKQYDEHQEIAATAPAGGPGNSGYACDGGRQESKPAESVGTFVFDGWYQDSAG